MKPQVQLRLFSLPSGPSGTSYKVFLRSDLRTTSQIRATNLEQFFQGFLSYGCSNLASGGVVIQSFDHTRGSNEKYPEYQCTLAKEDCHKYDDCHLRPMWCSCQGESCVHFKFVEQDTGVSKQTAYANTVANWRWKSPRNLLRSL